MAIFGKLFRPGNALILAYDYLDHEGSEALQAQLKEVRQYYRMVKLSEIVDALRQRESLGMAAVVFTQARKSLIVRGLSRTRDESIPITVFVDADRVGSNRLPLAEELDIYERHYPGKIQPRILADLKEKCWTAPAQVEQFLVDCRKEIGPLPLNELDPTKYFATWGNLREIPPSLVEFGLSVTADPAIQDVRAQLKFARQQVKQPVVLAFSPRPVPATAFDGTGVEGILGTTLGPVESKTDRWSLPQWQLLQK